MSITVKHVAKFSSFLEKLVCYRNTLPESWFYSAKWIIINSTLLCDNGFTHFAWNIIIITSLDKFHLSCIIFGWSRGGILFRNIGITIGFDEGGVLFYVTGTIYRIPWVTPNPGTAHKKKVTASFQRTDMEVFKALVNSVNTFFFSLSFPTSFSVLRLPKIFLPNMTKKMITICSPNHCKPSGSTVCPTLWLATSPVPWKITEELSTQKSLFKRWLTY